MKLLLKGNDLQGNEFTKEAELSALRIMELEHEIEKFAEDHPELDKVTFAIEGFATLGTKVRLNR